MGSLIRPATPGFVITLAATILLAVVSFSVPLIKSVYFLKASLAAQGLSGDITFGTLGYCMSVDSSTTCSNATVGYELGQFSPFVLPQSLPPSKMSTPWLVTQPSKYPKSSSNGLLMSSYSTSSLLASLPSLPFLAFLLMSVRWP